MVFMVKKHLTTVLKISVTVAVIAFLIHRLGWREILSVMTTAKPQWLITALAVFLLSSLIGVVQWRLLLANRKIPLPFGRAYRLYLIGMFFNNFILGGIVGDVLKVASIRNRDGKGKAGLAATFLDRFAGLWAMCGFAVAGSIILLVRHGALNDGKVCTAMIALAATFLLFAGIIFFLVNKSLQKLFFSLLDLLPVGGKTRVATG